MAADGFVIGKNTRLQHNDDGASYRYSVAKAAPMMPASFASWAGISWMSRWNSDHTWARSEF